MGRDHLILQALQEGRIETDPQTGKIFSTRIRGREGERVELPGVVINGYIYHRIYHAGVKKQYRAHRLIWMAAHGVIPDGLMVDHINRDKQDNRLENLRLVDAKGNAANRDSVAGEKNPAAKITDAQADEIRVLYATGDTTLKELADQFGLSKSRVHSIVTAHPVTSRVDRLKGLGNAVVPQVVAWFGQQILRVEAGL